MKNLVIKLIFLIPLYTLIAQTSTDKNTTNVDSKFQRGLFGVTYSVNSDLGIVVDLDIRNSYVIGMGFVMNLDSYKGIGDELENFSVTDLGKVTSEPKYKQMGIFFNGGIQLNKSIAFIGGLGYINKREYYQLNTDNGYSKVSYNYHVETGNVYGALYASIKARVLLSRKIVFSAGAGTNSFDFGLYYSI